MTVYVDTSAFFAVLDRDDSNHGAAATAWAQLLGESTTLVTNNYVLVEASALVQHRLGVAALRAFHDDIVPLLKVHWVTEELHRSAVQAALSAARKKLSLVDCSSFQTMREMGVKKAFCVDKHFREQGFEVMP
jgi:predicted nucleic acid-binding protein